MPEAGSSQGPRPAGSPGSRHSPGSPGGLKRKLSAGVHGAYYGVDQGAFRVQSKAVESSLWATGNGQLPGCGRPLRCGVPFGHRKGGGWLRPPAQNSGSWSLIVLRGLVVVAPFLVSQRPAASSRISVLLQREVFAGGEDGLQAADAGANRVA